MGITIDDLRGKCADDTIEVTQHMLIPILFHICNKAAMKAGERPPVGRVWGGSPNLELE